MKRLHISQTVAMLVHELIPSDMPMLPLGDVVELKKTPPNRPSLRTPASGVVAISSKSAPAARIMVRIAPPNKALTPKDNLRIACLPCCSPNTQKRIVQARGMEYANKYSANCRRQINDSKNHNQRGNNKETDEVAHYR